MTVSAHTHLFWITSRAAGITALVLASITVGIGLTMGGRLIRGSNPDRRALHEVLSLSVMLAVALHGLSLIGDTYLHPTLADVTIPFAESYKQIWTTVGIVAGWGLIVLGLSYYVRKRIGMNRWKVIHRFTALAWIAGLIHAFTEGTDAGQTWFIALILLSAAPAAIALGWRLAKGLTGSHGTRRPHSSEPALSA